MSIRDIFRPLLLISVVGVPVYLVAFMFVYGFRDSISVGHHVAFLVIVAVFAVLMGTAAAAVALRQPGSGPRGRVEAFGVLVALALNAAVVGAGSVVSSMHKDEGSVSADFGTVTDVLVAAALFATAIGCAAAARRIAVTTSGSAHR